MTKSISSALTIVIVFGTFAVTTFLGSSLNAQEAVSVPGHRALTTNEKQALENMKKEGVSDADIEKWKMKRELISLGEKNTFSQVGQSNQPLEINASCGDMGAENNTWGAWKATTGSYQNGIITWDGAGSTTPTGPRFNFTTGPGRDACSATVPGTPPLLLVSPSGFGTTSIQLGEPNTPGSVGGCNGGCVERLTYPLLVGNADTNFIYSYAIMLENPTDPPGDPVSHDIKSVPYAEIYILDKNGAIVPCSHQKYLGDTTGKGTVQPGFYRSTCRGGTGDLDVVYKPWTTVGVTLSNYKGQTLTVVITNVDCAAGGHFCHSYWDFACPPIGTSSPTFCLGSSTTLIAPPSDPQNPYTYQWYQGGTLISGATAGTITPTPKIGDVFSVHVHQNSNCDFWVPYIPKPITVTPSFLSVNRCGTVDFTGSATTSDNSQITQWSWNFGGATPNTSGVQNPTGIVYPVPGTYTATLTVTSKAGCQDDIKIPVIVTGAPKGTFTFVAPQGCSGGTITFSGNSVPAAGATYLWDFGDAASGASNSSTQQNPSHLYSASGTYTVTMTASLGAGCEDIITHVVSIMGTISANFSVLPVCQNIVSKFTGTSTDVITQWDWNFGDGSVGTGATPTHTYASCGVYTSTLIVTGANAGCKDTIVQPVIINCFPKSSFSSTTVCYGNPTLFSDLSTLSSGNITGWIWDFGDPNSGVNNTSSLSSPSHVFTQPNSYNVILTVTSDKGCQSISTYPVTFSPPPVALFVSTSVCLNTPTNFTSNSTSVSDPINSWDWNYGDGSAHGSGTAPVHAYSTAGNYTVGLIVTTVGGCKDTVENPVTVYGIPVANYSDPAQGCAPVCATFKNQTLVPTGESIATWQWDCPGGTPAVSSDKDPSFCWNTPGTYDVQLIVTTNHGCKDTMITPQYIHVYSWPKADFCVAPLIAPSTDPVFNFCDQWTSNVSNWVWDFGDNSTLDTSNTNPVHSYSAAATNNDFYTYTICLHVETPHGCADSICKEVNLLPEFTFYIPNTFTPNEDNLNDLFYGKSRGVKDYNIWIFDRWGNQVWDCHHTGKNTDWDATEQEGMSSFCRWDGKVVQGGLDMNGRSGQFSQEDVYVWKVQLTDIFGKHHSYVGHVNIIR